MDVIVISFTNEDGPSKPSKRTGGAAIPKDAVKNQTAGDLVTLPVTDKKKVSASSLIAEGRRCGRKKST